MWGLRYTPPLTVPHEYSVSISPASLILDLLTDSVPSANTSVCGVRLPEVSASLQGTPLPTSAPQRGVEVLRVGVPCSVNVRDLDH